MLPRAGDIWSMNRDEQKQLAQALYIAGNNYHKDIAKQVGITPKTLRNWIDKNNWEDLKTAKSITRKELLTAALNQLKALNKEIEENHNGIPNKQLSDAKGVLIKEINALSDQPLYKYVESFEDYLVWLNSNHPVQVKKTAELTMQFLQELNEKSK